MSKVHWVNQYVTLSNQSNFHEQIRKLFCTSSYFSKMKCYQEINVRDLVEDYDYHSHHYDWYIEELSTVLELHGKQHYEPTAFGRQSYHDTQVSFNTTKFRDNEKYLAAKKAGLYYVVLPYTYYKKSDAEVQEAILQGILDDE